MKKILAALLGLSLLAGCSNETVDQPKQTVTKQENEAMNEENKVLENKPEFDILAEFIDLKNYVANIQTDNEGTRVILFEDDKGNQTYKSVFVKRENHLKIIKLDDDGLIYNEIIK